MPTKITTIEIRPSSVIEWSRTAIFGSEYEVFKHKHNPNVLEMHEEISDDQLTRTLILIVNDDWDRWNNIQYVDNELVIKFKELSEEYCLTNNITISQLSEQID